MMHFVIIKNAWRDEGQSVYAVVVPPSEWTDEDAGKQFRKLQDHVEAFTLSEYKALRTDEPPSADYLCEYFLRLLVTSGWHRVPHVETTLDDVDNEGWDEACEGEGGV
jgi:hypothetical protein